jgi:hypothetical protein
MFPIIHSLHLNRIVSIKRWLKYIPFRPCPSKDTSTNPVTGGDACEVRVTVTTPDPLPLSNAKVAVVPELLVTPEVTCVVILVLLLGLLVVVSEELTVDEVDDSVIFDGDEVDDPMRFNG